MFRTPSGCQDPDMRAVAAVGDAGEDGQAPPYGSGDNRDLGSEEMAQ